MELRDLKVNDHDACITHSQIAEIIQEKSDIAVINELALAIDDRLMSNLDDGKSVTYHMTPTQHPNEPEGHLIAGELTITRYNILYDAHIVKSCGDGLYTPAGDSIAAHYHESYVLHIGHLEMPVHYCVGHTRLPVPLCRRLLIASLHTALTVLLSNEHNEERKRHGIE